MAYAPLARLSLPRIVRWRVVPVRQSSPVTSHPVASFHPLTNTISDDVLTAGIMLGELTSARVHLASHLFSFVFQLTHSTPLGVSMVGPIASTPIILSFIFSVVWLILFTTKASYPAVTTDCSDCTHSVEAGNPHVMSNVPAKRLLPESTGLASAGMASRQKATSFILFAPSVITTSLSSSLPNPISVGVAPVPYPSLIHGAIGPPSYSAFHAPSLSLSENFPFLHISFCMSPLPLASLALLATYTPPFSSTAIEFVNIWVLASG